VTAAVGDSIYYRMQKDPDTVIFAIGYEGLGIARFVKVLKDHEIRTLLDCRYNAYSRNPDFSKTRLASHLDGAGIKYEHLRQYGIPSGIRNSGNAIEWYIANVKPNIRGSLLGSYDQPVCFMCMERDINSCHRKVILEAMREQGIEGMDLYPKENNDL
jgi:uncharacterized protein (DUF488 family)